MYFNFFNFRAPDPETEEAVIPVEDLPQYVWTALVFAVNLIVLCACQRLILPFT